MLEYIVESYEDNSYCRLCCLQKLYYIEKYYDWEDDICDSCMCNVKVKNIYYCRLLRGNFLIGLD